MQALDFSSAFKSVVGHLRLAPGGYVPELMAPEEPSTRGGQHARQRIRLVSTAGASDRFPTLVVGSANVKSGKAELRSFDYVDAVHRAHFGRPLELDRTAYGQFLELVRNYFAVAQLDVTTEDTPPAEVLLERRPKASRGALVFVIVAAIFAVLALGYYFFH